MVLLIDNYDSFTWNLAHRLGEVGAEVTVVRNDAISVDDVLARQPSHVVISPGPGRPEDAGISMALIQRLDGRIPLLGVCLGHQSIAAAFGGQVRRAPVLMHGKTSVVAHDGKQLFSGLARTFEVGRYHSLLVPRDGVPAGFDVSAWVDGEDTVMGLRHESKPVFGVQFHPESVLTPTGHRLLQNFLEVH